MTPAMSIVHTPAPLVRLEEAFPINTEIYTLMESIKSHLAQHHDRRIYELTVIYKMSLYDPANPSPTQMEIHAMVRGEAQPILNFDFEQPVEFYKSMEGKGKGLDEMRVAAAVEFLRLLELKLEKMMGLDKAKVLNLGGDGGYLGYFMDSEDEEETKVKKRKAKKREKKKEWRARRRGIKEEEIGMN